jgi:hypothetical protein
MRRDGSKNLGYQSLVQVLVVDLRGTKAIAECVEAIGNVGQFLNVGTREAMPKLALLQLAQAIRQTYQRMKQAPERKIEYPEHDQTEYERYKGDIPGVMPNFGDLIGSVPDNDDGTDVTASRDDLHFAADIVDPTSDVNHCGTSD